MLWRDDKLGQPEGQWSAKLGLYSLDYTKTFNPAERLEASLPAPVMVFHSAHYRQVEWAVTTPRLPSSLPVVRCEKAFYLGLSDVCCPLIITGFQYMSASYYANTILG
jgi:hypothetical protein